MSYSYEILEVQKVINNEVHPNGFKVRDHKVIILDEREDTVLEISYDEWIEWIDELDRSIVHDYAGCDGEHIQINYDLSAEEYEPSSDDLEILLREKGIIQKLPVAGCSEAQI